MPQYFVREFDLRSDKKKILSLWSEENVIWSPTRLDWHNKHNGFKSSKTWVLINKDTENVVGCASIIFREFIIEQQKILAGINCDFLVSRHHRTLGPSLMLIRKIVEDFSKQDAKFLLAFPNKKGKPAFSRCGYIKAGEMNRVAKILSCEEIFKKKITVAIFHQVFIPITNFFLQVVSLDTWDIFPFFGSRIQLSHKTPENFSFAEEIVPIKGVTLCGNFSKFFFQWRHLDPINPVRNQILYLLEKEKCIGFISLLPSEKTLIIEDMLIADHSRTQAVLNAIIRYARWKKYHSVTISIMGGGAYRDLLKRNGFINRASDRSVLIYCIDPDLSSKLLKESNWLLWDGDVDI